MADLKPCLNYGQMRPPPPNLLPANNAHLGQADWKNAITVLWTVPSGRKQDFSLASRRVKRKSKMFAEKKENTTRRKTGGS